MYFALRVCRVFLAGAALLGICVVPAQGQGSRALSHRSQRHVSRSLEFSLGIERAERRPVDGLRPTGSGHHDHRYGMLEWLDTIGRSGGGPGEYQTPMDLFPWRARLHHPGRSGEYTRFTFVGPDGGFGESMPLMSQEGDMMRFVMPAGTDDARQHLLPGPEFWPADPGYEWPTGLCHRLPAGTCGTTRRTPMVALKTPERKMQTGGGNVMIASIPFSPQDDWAVGLGRPSGRSPVALTSTWSGSSRMGLWYVAQLCHTIR